MQAALFLAGALLFGLGIAMVFDDDSMTPGAAVIGSAVACWGVAVVAPV